ncbi:allantoate deiminase [Cohnella silvisoli]|uniref:Allantoate deiminase n=1 Tax=Cohnella silvisoli TaxID=2873699 RepID=A0ABV1KVB4_9BACL|nr:allantoate deiminase [Cohnella silvisoli]MCD9023327.1 allantoate deiminase [Cohnella silvisoli]
MDQPVRFDMGSELWLLLEKLATFTEGTEATGGVTRLLYTQPWKEAQAFLAETMTEAGLDVRFDKVGNLFGRLQGSNPDVPVILTGSHIDTVRNGGKLDGAYGIMGGIAALKYLKETHGTPIHTLEVVSFCEEEGSRFPIAYWGSGNVTGLFDPHSGQELLDVEGTSLQSAMEASGFGLRGQPDCKRGDLGAFVELHIEQGVILERMAKQIGIVEAIVGQRRYSVSLRGEANHAGTTPMNMRSDAMACAAEMIVRLELLAARAAALVATVGRIQAAPNIPNVIPGTVEFTLDIRHDNEGTLSWFCDYLFQEYEDIANRRGLGLAITPWLATTPVPMDRSLAEQIEQVCGKLSLSHRRMFSGAGHDAQLFSPICPTAMIFVPSKAGISHSPDEYSSPEQLSDGVSVLASLLYEMAYEEQAT